MSQSSSHVCPTTVTSHYTAFLSHPIGCDAISPNGERMRRCWRGGPPWDHLGATRTTKSQKLAFSGRVTGFYHYLGVRIIFTWGILIIIMYSNKEFCFTAIPKSRRSQGPKATFQKKVNLDVKEAKGWCTL